MTTGIKVLATLAIGFVLTGPVSAYDNGNTQNPQGRWERKSGKAQVSVTFTGDRMHVNLTGEKPCVLHADYCVSKDGIIFGLFTSIEADDDDTADDLVDHPFSFRCRIDEGSLIIRDFKSTGGSADKDNPLVGRFKMVPASSTPAACYPPPPTYYPPAAGPASLNSGSTPPPPPVQGSVSSYKPSRPVRMRVPMQRNEVTPR